MTKLVSSVPEKRFKKYGVEIPKEWEVTFIASPFTQEQLSNACKGADFLLVGSVEPIERSVFEQNGQLKLVHVEGVGFNKVDTEAAKAAGIRVCNNRATNNAAVAEHTIGLMLAAMRRTTVCNAQILSDGYALCLTEQRARGVTEIGGKRIGIVGIGAIGKEVAKRLAAWGVEIYYYDAFRPAPEVEQALNVSYLPFDELVATCDIVSMHVPVLPATIGMMGKEQFAAMKPSAYLINTSRGEVIDQDALADALEDGRIAGAALDTLTPEPAPRDLRLLNLSPAAQAKLIVTPHVGGTTDEAFTRMLNGVIANFTRVINGEEPINVVNP